MLVRKLREAIDDGRTYGKWNTFQVDEIIGKLHYREKKANNEFELGKMLYGEGIQVPEMYEMAHVPGLDLYVEHTPGVKEHCEWAVFMQRIDGNIITMLRGDERIEAMRQFKREVLKVLDFGIIPDDCDWAHNNLFSWSENKLYLLDLENWYEGNPKELAAFYKLIKGKSFTFKECDAHYNLPLL